MLLAAVIYLAFTFTRSEQSSLSKRSCSCAEYTPVPCVCHAGAIPHCICRRIIQSWTCTCAVELQVIECYNTCRPLCVSTCQQDKIHPGCAFYCNGICAQSCTPTQSILPIASALVVPVDTPTLLPPRNPVAPTITATVPLPLSNPLLPTDSRNPPAPPFGISAMPAITKYPPVFPDYPVISGVTGVPSIRPAENPTSATDLPATLPRYSMIPTVSGMPPTIPPTYPGVPAAAAVTSPIPPVYHMEPAASPITVRDICPYSSYELCQRACAGTGSALCFPLCMQHSERICGYHRLHRNSSQVVNQPTPPQARPLF
ncbi:unnamed protein product [Cylicocyclus nassatus]|uniref:Uncharacterized protein n=1 Tax=Cylicocyclus nassatus TaxID=53992 RepID=A0AA36GL53_CYLNA|nr:unnamed protein product [Cylicocyclus nassatus]